jgi:photosystem II stability/assembly factor-like uncharacterized protein
MKKLLLILSILSFSANAQGDYWTEVGTNQPAVANRFGTISYADASNVWANVSCGTTGCAVIRRYARSTDGGSTWITAPVDLGPSSTSLTIGTIHGVSATEAYISVFPSAAGAIGGIWKTINGGTSWTRQSTASYNFPQSFANLVHFWGTSNIGVTMGDPNASGFEVYRTTNGGTNWVAVTGLPPTSGIDEYGYSTNYTTFGDSIWITTAYGRLLKSNDRGLTWTISQTPLSDFGAQVNGTDTGEVAFSDANNGLILKTSSSEPDELFSTSDGGNTWAPVTSYTGVVRNFSITAITGIPNAYMTLGQEYPESEDPVTGEIIPAGPRGSSFTLDGGLTWTNINENPDLNFVDGGVCTFFSPTVGLASGFATANPAVGGVFKWNAIDLLANNTFSNDKAFRASPNPTTGLVALTGKNITNVIVTDILGKQVSNTNYSSLSNVNLDMTALNAGMYMVKVTNSEGNASTLKVVKQ